MLKRIRNLLARLLHPRRRRQLPPPPPRNGYLEAISHPGRSERVVAHDRFNGLIKWAYKVSSGNAMGPIHKGKEVSIILDDCRFNVTIRPITLSEEAIAKIKERRQREMQ